MENTGPEKEKAEVITAATTIWMGFCKKLSSESVGLYFFFTCLIFFNYSPPQSYAADPAKAPQQRYRILETSPVPNPRETPYPDCLTHILCQPITEAGSPAGEKVNLVFFAFRKRVLYPAAKLKPKDEVSLSTIPFGEASQKIRNLKQVNDLPITDAQILFASHWDRQEDFIASLVATEISPITPTSNRDLIIQTLIAHQGQVTGGVNQDFFFWTHVPEMYEADFWKIQPTKKNALGPLKSILLFKQHLAEKNIDLIFVPIPRSDTIYPGISTNIEYDPEIDGRINFAVRDLMDSLEAEGVTCVDLTPTFLANAYQKYDGKSYPIYRRNDTHWAPSGVRIAASLIADTIKKRPSFAKLTSAVPEISLQESISLEEFSYFMPVFDRSPSRRHPVETQPVYRIDSLNESDRELLNYSLPSAEIHLLGDSFCNAYGSGAGQAGIHPHLVNALKTPINKIASASGGSAISPNQFARHADLSKAKIVIWAVCESFLAAPNIWADIPLDRPGTLMLDKLLSRARLSHNAFTFNLASQKTPGSYITIGDPSSPDTLPIESRILWKNVHIADEAKSASFTVSTWVQKSSTSPTLPPLKNYPLSWELWINGALFQSQTSPSERDIFQQQKWKVKLNKFAGQTVDFELICRRTNPAQAIPGQPCWILPEIHGAKLIEANSQQSVSPPLLESTPGEKDETKQNTNTSSLTPLQFTVIAFSICLIGIVAVRILRRSRKTGE